MLGVPLGTEPEIGAQIGVPAFDAADVSAEGRCRFNRVARAARGEHVGDCALLESAAGFYGAQMNAMDNATRNAGDMINKLTLSYNRTRQANITTELIEIISGASAV